MNPFFKRVAVASLCVGFLTAVARVETASSFPGSTFPFDCYRKADNSYDFGSQTNVSNNAVLCVTNSDFQNSTYVAPVPSQAQVNSGGELVPIATGLLGFLLGTVVSNNSGNNSNSYVYDNPGVVYDPSYPNFGQGYQYLQPQYQNGYYQGSPAGGGSFQGNGYLQPQYQNFQGSPAGGGSFQGNGYPQRQYLRYPNRLFQNPTRNTK